MLWTSIDVDCRLNSADRLLIKTGLKWIKVETMLELRAGERVGGESIYSTAVYLSIGPSSSSVEDQSITSLCAVHFVKHRRLLRCIT